MRKSKFDELIGKRCTVTAVVTIDKTRDGSTGSRRLAPTAIAARCGWVIGRRTLQAGRIDYSYDGTSFTRTESQPVWLVAFSAIEKPAFVPLDALTIIDDEAQETASADFARREQLELFAFEVEEEALCG